MLDQFCLLLGQQPRGLSLQRQQRDPLSVEG